MKNKPKYLYIQIDADGETPEDFKDLVGISWCEDRTHANDLEYKYVSQTRSSKQNSALHLYFTHISEALNNQGETYNLWEDKQLNIDVMITPVLIKETLWKPIQLSLFNIESTTKLDSLMMNDIIDVVTGFLARKGIAVNFPDKALKYWEKELKERG